MVYIAKWTQFESVSFTHTQLVNLLDPTWSPTMARADDTGGD